MALWLKNMALSEGEKRLRMRKREAAIIVKNGWGSLETRIRYHGDYGFRPEDAYRDNECVESASNRRAAGAYVPNF